MKVPMHENDFHPLIGALDLSNAMGACCSTSSPSENEVVQGSRGLEVEAGSKAEAESNWERLGGGELEPPLRDGLVRCVDSRFLVSLFNSGGRIERMQDLPENAFIGLEDVKMLGSYSTEVYEGTIPFTTYEWLPVVILSYAWLGPSHPDPHAETLGVLAKALEKMKPHGVVIDFASLPQVPRTDEEGKRFKEGLKTFNVFYSHPHTLVFQVTDFPRGYPSSGSHSDYGLPEGHVPAQYQQRGWCFAEACISSLGKTPKFLCNLSNLHPSAEQVVGKCTDRDQRTPPPLSPSVFNEELSKKTFTQRKTDLARVQQLYGDAFRTRVGSSKSLMFAALDWGPAEIRSFTQVIEVNQLMQYLDLSRNSLGAEGMKTLGQVILGHPTLQSLKLVECELGGAGAGVLVEGLKCNSTLTTLNIGCNKLETDGARQLAEVLRGKSALTTLDVHGNNIGDEGARHLAEGLKENRVLTTLNVRGNEIEALGARALAEVVQQSSTLTALNISSNELGDEGARHLAEGLKGSLALTMLNVAWNSIAAEGACHLAEGLKQNNTLTSLDVRDNDLGGEGSRCLSEAARPGCSVHQ